MLNPLFNPIRSCTRCPLIETCFLPVPGDGPNPARIMFIGESPGEREDIEGIPFQGQAGKYLDYLLERVGIDRSECYITNLIKCHPPGNRDPLEYEIEACHSWLDAEIEIVRPYIIVCLGAFAARYICEDDAFTMDRGHGIPQVRSNSSIILPVYHPAAGLHQSRLMRFVQEDFEILGQIAKGVDPNQFIPIDQHPNPNYVEVTNERDARDILAQPRYALDTETITGSDSKPKLWSIQVSNSVGSGWFIPYELYARGRLDIPSTSRVIVHNYLYDAQFLTIPNPIDTMVAAYLLQLPMGLKDLAYRLCGMEMKDYTEYTKPYRRAKALKYLLGSTYLMREVTVPVNKKAKNPKKFKTIIEGWPDPPDLIDIEWDNKLGRMAEKVTHPHNINGKILERIRKALDDPGYLIYEKWYDIDQRERDIVEALIGKMPDSDLRDAPKSEAVYYSTRDSDATLRVWGVLEKMLRAKGLMEIFEMEMGR